MLLDFQGSRVRVHVLCDSDINYVNIGYDVTRARNLIAPKENDDEEQQKDLVQSQVRALIYKMKTGITSMTPSTRRRRQWKPTRG